MRLVPALLSFLLVACAEDAPRSTPDADTTSPDTLDTATPDTATPDTTDTADSSEPTDVVPDTTTPDTTTPDTAAPDTEDVVAPTCIELPPDHRRHVVISRPYSETGAPSDGWEVYPVLDDATLGARTAHFSLGAAGRAIGGKVAFTADGALALATHDMGAVSVFAIDGDGQVTVIQPATSLGLYVTSIVIDGDDVYLVDSNWQNNNGGIYHATLACDGTLSPPKQLYPTKLAYGLTLRHTADGLEHLLMAREAVDTTPGTAHRVGLRGGTWTRLASTDLFNSNQVITSAMAVTADQRYVLIADNAEYSDAPNSIGVASIDPLAPQLIISPLNDPYEMIASPHNDAILVGLGYANAVTVLRYDPAAGTFTNTGSPTLVTGAPQLPSEAVRLHGDHEDIVYMVENTALRGFRFNGDGTVSDLGRQLHGSGLTAIPGAIGAQP